MRNRLLKRFLAPLIYLLVSIFNAALSNSIFSHTWKSADVIGIHKPGKKATEPSSYRPISLLSSLGKIYERILMKRLWSHVHANNLIPNEQFGFRARHSCVQQVHRITEHILSGFNSNISPQGTYTVFLDVAKAFDKVWHNGLVYKLYQLGVPDRLVRIIQDFLRDRSFRYRVEGVHSSPHAIAAGVPQGSVLSPLLFSLYTSDIPRSPHVEIALFADDTAIYCTGWRKNSIRSRLQKALTDLGKWFLKWRISVNPDKSAAMYFHPRKLNLLSPLSLFGQDIPYVTSTKYLGVYLDRRLNFSKHITYVRNKAAFVLGRLYPLVCKQSKLSLRNKLTLYKVCVRPIMTYASQVFAHTNPKSLYKLQIIQNRFLRKALGARWYQRNVDLHCDVELPSIRHFMKEASRRFFDAALHHPNPLVVQASNYSTDTTDSRPLRSRRPRHVLQDPDDAIALAISLAATESSNSGLSNSIGTCFNPIRANSLRRRRRRILARVSPIITNISARNPRAQYQRYTHVPGRFSPVPPVLATAQAEVRSS